MPRKKPISLDQLDMHDLMSFQPANPVQAFAPETVRAASLARSISKAISAALKACGRPREAVAELMGDYLDETVSKNMLDAYASEARSDHIISVVRFIALIAATKDRRLLEFIAGQFGWTVIDRKYLRLVENAQMMEVRDEMTARIEANRRHMRRDGTL